MALNTITYDNKSDINNNTSIPAINKVQASDMNEIKTIVNNAVGYLNNNASKEILWTNSNPSAVTTMTIDLSNSDYDMLLVIVSHALDTNMVYSVISPKGKDIRLIGASMTGTLIRNMFRVSDTQYTLNNIQGSSSSLTDDFLIPLYVIGYKTGLF